jgi:hypothetical protein
MENSQTEIEKRINFSSYSYWNCLDFGENILFPFKNTLALFYTIFA